MNLGHLFTKGTEFCIVAPKIFSMFFPYIQNCASVHLHQAKSSR